MSLVIQSIHPIWQEYFLPRKICISGITPVCVHGYIQNCLEKVKEVVPVCHKEKDEEKEKGGGKIILPITKT